MSPTEPQSPMTKEEDDDETTPLGTLLTGLGALAFAGFLFYQFTNLEEAGGSMRVWWPVALMYNIGGKWPPVVLFALAGLVFLVMGVKSLLASKKAAA